MKCFVHTLKVPKKDIIHIAGKPVCKRCAVGLGGNGITPEQEITSLGRMKKADRVRGRARKRGHR